MKQVSDSLKFTLNGSCILIILFCAIVLYLYFLLLLNPYAFFISFLLFCLLASLFVLIIKRRVSQSSPSAFLHPPAPSLLSAQGPPILSPLLCHGGHLISRHTTSDKRPPGRQFSSDDGDLKTSICDNSGKLIFKHIQILLF